MKRLLFIMALIGAHVTSGGEFSGVKGVVDRFTGQGERFCFERAEELGERGEVSARDGKILIRAARPSIASYAAGRYLRDVAKAHESWCGRRIPKILPLPERTLTYESKKPIRLAYNYCTLSYTMANWGKEEWREEIDRLSLQGFNCALVVDGLMKVWQLTLRDMGYSEAEISGFIADRPYAAWWHMGNLEGAGGPISKARIEEDGKLGRWLYAEMKNAGVEPILQGFVGLVPSGTAGAISQGIWCGIYKRPALLPLEGEKFMNFSKCWYKNLKKVYGIKKDNMPKYIAGDIFHEGGNSSEFNDEKLAMITRHIQDMQRKEFGDEVVWILQSWQGTPPQGIRDGLSVKNSLIELLDKNMSGTGNCGAKFTSRPNGSLNWIWAEVLNFGGNPGMYGGMRRFGSMARLADDKDTSFKGYGMLSEGLETNPAMYDRFIEGFGAKGDVGESEFFKGYIERRYGIEDEQLEAAFKIFAKTVWNCPRGQEGCVENVLCAIPSSAVKSVSKWGPKEGSYYSRRDFAEGAKLFLASAERNPSLLSEETFRFDLVEVFLQMVADRLRELNAKIDAEQSARDEYRKLLALAVRLTSGEKRWTLAWHEHGRVRPAYRRLLTTWGDDTEAGKASGLTDYAHRAYSEMIRDYYGNRWEAYFQWQEGKLKVAEYESRLNKIDADFISGRIGKPESGRTDLVETCKAILNEVGK